MNSSLRQKLKECIPPAYYSDGREATCMWYKVFNMFDLDPQSYIVDKKNNGMKEFKISGDTSNIEYALPSKSKDSSVEITNLILDGHKVGIENGVVVVKK